MKVYKLMTVNEMAIQVDEGCRAKDLSRVRMRISEDGLPTHTHTTKNYAKIVGNELRWEQSFSFRYSGQAKLVFETYCEHEFGYEVRELQVLYQGVYHLTNEMFFRRDSCHVYTPEGEKMGVLRWEVRVETREEAETVEEKTDAPRPLVREDLIGLIKIEAMTLEVVNPVFNKAKYKALEVRVKFGQETWAYSAADGSWKFPEMKLQYVSRGSQRVEFEVAHEGRPLMEGWADCEGMERLKRYIKYKVPLFNRHGIKLCQLVLEYRFVEKKELLDLLYSPHNRLSNSMQRVQSTAVSRQHTPNKVSPGSKQRSFFQLSPRGKTSRYQIGYLMNRNSDILLPKAARFPPAQPVNPLVSYLDPERCSDFSPASKRGWHMSGGGKFDFTRQYRGNPGVGEYKLPSIWSKY